MRPLPGTTHAQVRIHSSVIGKALEGERTVVLTDDVAVISRCGLATRHAPWSFQFRALQGMLEQTYARL